MSPRMRWGSPHVAPHNDPCRRLDHVLGIVDTAVNSERVGWQRAVTCLADLLAAFLAQDLEQQIKPAVFMGAIAGGWSCTCS
jgi:hypothetical protein